VGFGTTLDSGAYAYYCSDGTPFVTIADNTGPLSFGNSPPLESGTVAINDAGRVAFVSHRDAGRSRVFTGNGDQKRPLVRWPARQYPRLNLPATNEDILLRLSAGLSSSKAG